MTRRPFFKQPAGLTVHEIAVLTGAQPRPGAKLDHVVTDIAALEHAGPSDLVFVDARQICRSPGLDPGRRLPDARAVRKPARRMA